MSKTTLQLRSAIQGLNIQKPFQLKKPARLEIKSTQNASTRNECSENRSAEPASALQGFFKLSHAIFADVLVRALPGESFRLFLWLSMQAYRFRESDGTTRASFRRMSAALGMAESSVGRAIEILVKVKLVKRVEINNKIGNRWWVSPVAYGRDPEKGSAQNQSTQNECSENGSEAPPESKRSVPNSGVEHTQNGSNIRNLQDPKNSKTLSLPENVAEPIERYFADLKPERKCESEWKAYESLKKDYSDAEILEAFSEIRSQDPDGIKYHSPMAYLSVSFEQILKTIQHKRRRERWKASVTYERHSARIAAEEKQELEEREWREHEALFLKEFPSPEEQQAAIETYAAEVPFGGEVMRRGLAISRWWDSTSQNSGRKV